MNDSLDGIQRFPTLPRRISVGDKRKEHPNYVGTAAWETLRKKNEYDEILYEYAKNMYDQQSTMYEKIPK